MSDAAPSNALLDLARRHTRGEVSPRRHQASRARVLDQLGHRPRRAWTTFAVAGLVAGGGAAAFAGTKHHYASPLPAPIEYSVPAASVIAAAPESKAEEEPTPETAKGHGIEIQATPENATIYVDDERLDDNPAVLERAADNKPHRIRVEAPGYRPKTQILLLDDVHGHVELELQPVPMTIGAITTSASITNADAVVESMRGAFETCYANGVTGYSALAGKVTLTLHVRHDGAVESTDVSERDGLNQRVLTCLAEQANALELTTTGKPGTVKIPMQFSRAK